jgi:hypothetical protein
MDDKTKLKKILELVTDEQMDIRAANKEDREYTSLKGNGVNASEAFLTFEPIAQRIQSIIAGEN